MTREQMIEQLVETDIADIQQELENEQYHFTTRILRNGWRGYDKMTDKEIEVEYKNIEIEEP